MTVTEKDSKDDKLKTSMLKTCIGQKGREIYETFTLDSADDEMTMTMKNIFSAKIMYNVINIICK